MSEPAFSRGDLVGSVVGCVVATDLIRSLGKYILRGGINTEVLICSTAHHPGSSCLRSISTVLLLVIMIQRTPSLLMTTKAEEECSLLSPRTAGLLSC